eukprot:sb/3466724/
MSKLVLLLLSLGLIPILAILLHRPTILPPSTLRSHLSGKIVLVAGASSGIGEQVAYRYATAGSHLILTARSLDKLSTVEAGCKERGAASVHVIPQDFSVIEELEEYRNKVLELHPGGVDILVLNHGAMPISPWMATPGHQDRGFVDRIYRINLLSYVELTRLFMPSLEARQGQIHVTGSMMGETPFFTAGLYASTKHGLHGFFKSLQQELLVKQSPVTVSIFAFGLIWTSEMEQVILSDPNGDQIPEFARGDVGETADIMISSAITKPALVDYPVAVSVLTRFMQMLPGFNRFMTMTVPCPYEQIGEISERMREVGSKMGYQRGNM